MTRRALLVQPAFPIPPKSKNHKDFLPIGLLKLGAWYKSRGWDVKLVYGNTLELNFIPNHILVTSLFTYWSEYVVDSARYYKGLFPKAKLYVGGIYASLLPDDCKKRTGADEVQVGVHPQAEKYEADYSLLDEKLDYQILHTSRGCFRRCSFCYTWKIEPEFKGLCSIRDKIHKNRVVFYDNNLLYNPCVKDLLSEMAEMRVNGKPVHYESQSGFDGRLLVKDSEIALLLKAARFENPRIAWDHGLRDAPHIKKQIALLVHAGYKAKEIYVFMLYNWRMPFKELEQKRRLCWQWGVQIADCRFRPYTQLYDHFDSRVSQTSKDYFIHSRWTDAEVKSFRRNIRRQNICVRMGFSYYHPALERKTHPDRQTAFELLGQPRAVVDATLDEVWHPESKHSSMREMPTSKEAQTQPSSGDMKYQLPMSAGSRPRKPLSSERIRLDSLQSHIPR